MQGGDMFVDLIREINSLKSTTKAERLEELAKKLPAAAIYAVGGIPVELNDWTRNLYTWMSSDVKYIKDNVKRGLGVSAALTYLNPNGKTIDELGEVCIEKKHTWAYHWMTVSIVLANQPLLVEMAFAHDTRFQLSWVVEKVPTGKVVGVTGTIKNWMDFTKHYNDLSFDEPTRRAMAECRTLLERYIVPSPTIKGEFIDDDMYEDYAGLDP